MRRLAPKRIKAPKNEVCAPRDHRRLETTGGFLAEVSGDDDPKVIKVHHARQLLFNPAGLQNATKMNDAGLKTEGQD